MLLKLGVSSFVLKQKKQKFKSPDFSLKIYKGPSRHLARSLKMSTRHFFNAPSSIATRAARLAGSTFWITPFSQRANPSLIFTLKI